MYFEEISRNNCQYFFEIEKKIFVDGILSSFNIDHYNDGDHPASKNSKLANEWKERHVRSVVHVWCNQLLYLYQILGD